MMEFDARDYSQFNLTIRLGSLLSLPSKIFHRLRRIDDLLNHDLDVQSAALGMPMPMTTAWSASNGEITHIARPPPARNSLIYELVNMPGPFAFVASGYAPVLVALALLLNRIQHIVVPPRRSLAYRIVRSRRSVFHAMFYSFFPIDLSSTACRFTLRIPSLYLLYKSIALLVIILLQVSKLFPETDSGLLAYIGNWAGRKEMADVCWSVYMSVCASLVVGALTRGLEGPNDSNTQPFNVFGYAMLLHIYSMPVTHVNKSSPSRPETNTILTLLFPLLQLTLVHSMGVKKSWSKYRLVPTSICSLATIIHFNAVLLTKPASYPMLNYLPCLLETMLFLITLLTIGLNALTQLLLEGEISQPLFGHAQTLAPKWDEDFAVALLRLGTASLEATNVAGLGNEVGHITAGDSQLVDARARNISTETEGIVELNSAGVMSITSNSSRKGANKTTGGFAHEIKHVKVKNVQDDWLFDRVWLREVGRFSGALVAVARGIYRVFLWLIWYKWKGARLRSHSSEGRPAAEVPIIQHTHVNSRTGRDFSDSIYGRFLRGEDVSDDEEEYTPLHDPTGFGDSREHSIQASDEEEEPDTEDDDSDGGNGVETAGLYSDLLSNSAMSSSESPGTVLIAHMTADYASPLTRRRYNELVAVPYRQHSPDIVMNQRKDELGDFIRDRRAQASAMITEGSSTGDFALEGRMNCVICTSEPREIICWPCKCLALCNDCRENLASRVSASAHNCPCCRRSVEGYSKIYIP